MNILVPRKDETPIEYSKRKYAGALADLAETNAPTDAPTCRNCGTLMQRAGSCHTCPTCGTSDGCG